jgi:hypothetical protein
VLPMRWLVDSPIRGGRWPAPFLKPTAPARSP